MFKSKPVSDLRDYNKVLHEVHEGSPIYLTKNGVEKYTLVDSEEYQKQKKAFELMKELYSTKSKINAGERVYSQEEIEREFGVKNED